MKSVAMLMVAMLVASVGIAGETIQLKGTYVWSARKGQEDVVTAVVTPQEDGTMSITYTANFKDKPRVYTGTITGNLKNGTISGTAVTKGGTRNWVIRGKAENGTITCKHFEIKGTGDQKRENYTGTVTLKRDEDE